MSETSRKLWVDDIRRAPKGWDWARTSAEALQLLADNEYDVVSLDHDLGMIDDPIAEHPLDPGEPYGGGYVDTTRRIVLHWCENGGWPGKVFVHSSNPVGVEWLNGMLSRYKPRSGGLA